LEQKQCKALIKRKFIANSHSRQPPQKHSYAQVVREGAVWPIASSKMPRILLEVAVLRGNPPPTAPTIKDLGQSLTQDMTKEAAMVAGIWA